MGGRSYLVCIVLDCVVLLIWRKGWGLLWWRTGLAGLARVDHGSNGGFGSRHVVDMTFSFNLFMDLKYNIITLLLSLTIDLIILFHADLFHSILQLYSAVYK